MAIGEKDQSFLNIKKPSKKRDESDYLLSLNDISQTKEALEIKIKTETQKVHPKVEETKEALRLAINSLSGTKKILEQVYGDGADVSVLDTEKDLKKALSRVFGSSNTSEITFDMYKEAIAKRREYADKIKESVIREQIK